MESASAGRRTGAAVVDVVLFYALHMVALVVFADRLPDSVASKTTFLAAVYAALLFLYGSPEIWGMATPGKRLVGLRVLATKGDEAPRRNLALRWLLKSFPIWVFFVVSFALAFGAWRIEGRESIGIVAMSSAGGVFLVYALVDFLVAFGPKRQALRDRIAGTVVADVRGRSRS